MFNITRWFPLLPVCFLFISVAWCQAIMDRSSAIKGYKELDKYVNHHLDLTAMEAAKRLIKKSETGSWLSSKPSSSATEAAKGFLHLLTADGCTQETLERLQEMKLAHWFQTPGDEIGGRLHLHEYDAIDWVLDTRIELLLSRCFKYLDGVYLGKLGGLSSDIKEVIFNQATDEMVAKYDQTSFSDFKVQMWNMLRKSQYDGDKRSKRGKQQQPPANVNLDAMFQNVFVPSCNNFVRNFNQIMSLIRDLDWHADKYRIGVDHIEQVQLAKKRYSLCAQLIGPL